MFNKTSSSPRRFRVQSPFIQNVRSRFGKIGLWAFLVLVPIFFLRACAFTYVPPDEIGIRQVEFGPNRGLQKESVLPGYRREISGYETIRTYPREIQVVEFTNNEAEASIEEGDVRHRRVNAIKVPTVDGYPVDVDVTVLYRIADPYKVASKFGFSDAYKEAVVIRFTDPLVKQFLGELLAEEFYGEARLQNVRELRRALAQRFEPNGLALADVLVRQYDYPETFQSLTEQKKIQDQAVLANREFTKQAEVQTRLNQRLTEGQNLIQIKTAEYEALITGINAQRELYARQKRAEADLLVRSAEADGTEMINRAMEGPGSAKLLRLRRGLALLESIKGPIYINEDPTALGRSGGN